MVAQTYNQEEIKKKYMEGWRKRKALKEEVKRREQEKQEQIEKAQKEEILSVLAEYGVLESEVQTSGYWFKFDYGGFFIWFVNQTERLCGEMYTPPANEEEQEAIRSWCSRDNSTEKDRFQKAFNYRHFVFYGSPKKTVRKVIGLAETSLEKVMKRQDDHLTVKH